MPTPSIETARGWLGRVVVDRDSNKIGEVVDIYLDNETDRPEWAVVRTGLFGLRSSFVPLAEAREVGDEQQAIGWSNRRIAEAMRHHRRLLWGGDETRPPQVSLRTAAPFKRSGGNDRAGGPVVEPGRLRYDRQGRRVYLHPGARRDDLPSQ